MKVSWRLIIQVAAAWLLAIALALVLLTALEGVTP